MPGTSSKLLDWGRAEWCRTETSRDSCSLWPVLSSLPHFPSLPSDYPLLIFLIGLVGESGTLNKFKISGQGGKGTYVHTINILEHVVSVCVVYASVTSKSYGPIATWSDFLRNSKLLFTDDITNGYGCGYGQMETCQHNLTGAIFFYVYVCGCGYGYGQKET